MGRLWAPAGRRVRGLGLLVEAVIDQRLIGKHRLVIGLIKGKVACRKGRRKQNQEHKRCLINTFFDPQADVASHQAFNEKQQDHPTVHYWNRQKIEDPEVQADRSAQAEERSPAFFLGCLAGLLCDTDRSGKHVGRSLALN